MVERARNFQSLFAVLSSLQSRRSLLALSAFHFARPLDFQGTADSLMMFEMLKHAFYQSLDDDTSIELLQFFCLSTISHEGTLS